MSIYPSFASICIDNNQSYHMGIQLVTKNLFVGTWPRYAYHWWQKKLLRKPVS